MYKKNGQYYFKFLDNKVFDPDFPKEFDTLLIEHADKKWYIPRNKLIDKFIRKSKKVYNKVGEGKNPFILKLKKMEMRFFLYHMMTWDIQRMQLKL